MRWLLLVTLLVPLAFTQAGAADAIDGAQVGRLVQQLGSPSRREREQAEAALVDAGPDVLDLLPATPRDTASEVAIERVRRALEQDAAKQAGLASVLTLHGTLNHEQLAQAIETQTKQAVRFAAGLQPAVITVDWDRTSFWQALEQLESQTNSMAVGDSVTQALLLSNRAPEATKSSSATSGPCRVEILSQSLRPNLVHPSLSVLQVRWRVRAEPRLRPLYLIVADRDCSLSDGATSFEAISPDARREIPCDRWEGCEVDTPFQVPRSLDLEGLTFALKARLKVAAMPLKLAFGDLDQPVPAPRRRGAVSGIMRNVRFDEGQRTLTFDLAVTYDRGGPEFESHRMWIYQNAAWLGQKTGKNRISPTSVELKQIAGSGATLGYTFENVNGSPGDYEFIYEAPSLVIDVPIEVESLKLPGVAKNEQKSP